MSDQQATPDDDPREQDTGEGLPETAPDEVTSDEGDDEETGE